MGAHAHPFYRVVVSDSRRRPEGRVVEEIGHHDPMKNPKTPEIDLARFESWVGKGARPSDTVAALVKKQAAREKAEAQATA
jgi:small subunit ribosomal protein S16